MNDIVRSTRNRKGGYVRKNRNWKMFGIRTDNRWEKDLKLDLQVEGYKQIIV